MKVVIQRVMKASVEINKEIHNSIGTGILIFLGIEDKDGISDIEWLAGKISNLRIFNDDKGVMNYSIKDIKGDILVISQFTLYASTRKGNRPSYIKASKPDIAIPLYDKFIDVTEKVSGLKIKAGVFGADMKVELINDGPVTIIIDSKCKE